MPDQTFTYYGSVQNSQIKLPKKMQREIKAAFEGRTIEVTVKRKRKRRSSEQNRYYWGVVVRIISAYLIDFAPEQDATPQVVHQYLKERFLPLVLQEKPKMVLPTGEVVEGVYSTTKLTTVQFMDYIERVLHWAAELDMIIPDPDPGYWSGGSVDIDKM